MADAAHARLIDRVAEPEQTIQRRLCENKKPPELSGRLSRRQYCNAGTDRPRRRDFKLVYQDEGADANIVVSAAVYAAEW